jgi:hypothetical protein
MAAKPLVPPRDLFDQLREDLKTEADSIAREGHLSLRQKLDRYLEHLKRFDAAWLLRLARRKSAAGTAARDRIDAAIAGILAAVTHTASFSLVSVPPGVVPLGLTPDGDIEPIEYPDLPAEMKAARHLVEFPPAAFEGQRKEALRRGDRDQVRCGDEPAPADDPRPMPERLAEWEKQVKECVRQDAPRRKAAEEIYRPHGVFEQAMPANTLTDRICFRSERKFIERTLRHDLMSRAERLLLDVRVTNKGRQIPMSTKAPSSSSRGERTAPIKLGRPLQGKRPAPRIRRSREVHAECDAAMQFLGWSAHNWADRTNGCVKHSAIDRLLNGRTKRMRRLSRRALFDVMKEELTRRGRLDLLMTSPRWTGEL